MKEAVYWAALSVAIAFTLCQKPQSTASTGPPEFLVTEVVQKEVPVIRQWVGTLNGIQNAQVRARETGYLRTIACQQGGYVKKAVYVSDAHTVSYHHCGSLTGLLCFGIDRFQR